MFLSTKNPPYEELIVNISTPEDVKAYVVIDPEVVTFNKESRYNVNYTIWVKENYPNEELTIKYVLSGKDKFKYALDIAE